MRMSIVIPTWEANGVGHKVIKYAFTSLEKQTFKDFEVVVSDQSVDNLTEEVCEQWKDRLNIVYTREEKRRGYFTANENNGIKHCSGEIIKFLDADDYLYDWKSLEIINDAFTDNVNWLATDYLHSHDRTSLYNRHRPVMNERIYIVNSIGTPSCLAVRNVPDLPLFDEELKWAGDCEWYKRLYDKFGNPKIVSRTTIVHLLWNNNVEKVLTDEDLRKKEETYILNKHEPKEIKIEETA